MVNQILVRLEELLLAWKNIGEDIAHDRTPLTSVRTRLERARDQKDLPEDRVSVIDKALEGGATTRCPSWPRCHALPR